MNSKDSVIFSLLPGDAIKRKDLHRRFGGIQQGGISPSRKTKNVFIFTDPVGLQFGYTDDWKDGDYHYVGSGQTGDQQIARVNKSLLEHERDGKVVRLFEGAKGSVVYRGAFRVVNHYFRNERDVRGKSRKVLVFVLRGSED